MNETIYYSSNNNQFWIVSMSNWTGTPDDNLKEFIKILPKEFKNTNPNNLGFNLYKDRTIEIIDYTNGVWKWKSYKLISIENINLKELKEKIIKYINEIQDIEKQEQEDFINSIKKQENIEIISEIMINSDYIKDI